MFPFLDPKASVSLTICHNILHSNLTSQKNPFTAHGHASRQDESV